jgi:hypothetical protein
MSDYLIPSDGCAEYLTAGRYYKVEGSYRYGDDTMITIRNNEGGLVYISETWAKLSGWQLVNQDFEAETKSVVYVGMIIAATLIFICAVLS